MIPEIVQDDVVSAPHKNNKGKLLMLDWHNDEMAPTQTSCNACPLVERTVNADNVGFLHSENEPQSSSHGFSYLSLLELSDCDPMDSFIHLKVNNLGHILRMMTCSSRIIQCLWIGLNHALVIGQKMLQK